MRALENLKLFKIGLTEVDLDKMSQIDFDRQDARIGRSHNFWLAYLATGLATLVIATAFNKIVLYLDVTLFVVIPWAYLVSMLLGYAFLFYARFALVPKGKILGGVKATVTEHWQDKLTLTCGEKSFKVRDYYEVLGSAKVGDTVLLIQCKRRGYHYCVALKDNGRSV